MIKHHGDSVVVKIGSMVHLMLDVYYIEWIVLETTIGYQKKDLNACGKAEGRVCDDVAGSGCVCIVQPVWVMDGKKHKKRDCLF